ncbi:hypothetical protein ACMDCR_29360 [Labrys okinawensis]
MVPAIDRPMLGQYSQTIWSPALLRARVWAEVHESVGFKEDNRRFIRAL